MSRYINISARAYGDVRRILKGLRKQSPKGAAAWYDAYWSAVIRVSENADSFSLVDEATELSRSVRQVLFKTRRGRRYRIVFDYSDEEIFILRVRQPGQRPLREGDLTKE